MAGKCLSFIVIVILCSSVKSNSFKLKQVLVLSRHNIRTPLTTSSKIQQITAQEWPTWPLKSGLLTPKGAWLEGYVGKYFSEWLIKEELLPPGCPEEGTVNIYANTKQRTKHSAFAFTKNAFPLCNVTVNFKNLTITDPVFNPVVRNTSEEFKNIVINEMNKKLNDIDLMDAYGELQRILDYEHSPNCIFNNKCSMVKDTNKIIYIIGEEPDVLGPFSIGNAAVDTLLMSYYDGKPIEDIGWGRIVNDEQWKVLTKFASANQDVRFHMSYAAKDLGRPLINYIAETLISKNETLFTLLMGHDSNLNTVMAALDFKSYELPGQYEMYPVGGRLVFQKFVDDNGLFYLKVEYVYLSSTDIRKGVELSLDNPPQRVTLELNKCILDKHGFCPWNDFVEILKEFV